jgi:hypothetical protein
MSSNLNEILEDLDFILVDYRDFGLSAEVSAKTNVYDCVIKANQLRLNLCNRATSLWLFENLKRRLCSLGNLYFGPELPKYITIIEQLHGNYYTCSTIYFERNFFFFVAVRIDHSDVFGSFLFDKKLIFE